MRRIVLILCCLLGAALIALAVLPWWLGPVLRLTARKQGVTFASYERSGYGRLVLREVAVDRGNVRAKIDRLEADSPVVWWMRRWLSQPRPVTLSTWSVEILRSDSAANPRTESSGWPELREQLRTAVAEAMPWLPRANAGAGTVKWPGGEARIGAAEWRERTLTLDVLSVRGLTADIRAVVAPDGDLRLEAKSAAGDWQAHVASAKTELTGEMRLWGQIATLRAELPERGWIPREATVRAEKWEVPAARMKLDRHYSVVRGDVRFDWRDGNFDVSADLSGEARPDQKAPPLEARLRGRGDAGALTVESLLLSAPGINARLSQPVVLDRQGQMSGGSSLFAVDADLGQWPWLTAQGQVTGEIRLAPRDGNSPLITGKLEGRDLVFHDWTAPRVTADASLDWPRLNVTTGAISFGDGGNLTVHGGWDFRASEILDAAIEGTVRHSVIARWLPEIRFEQVQFSAKADGPLATAKHQGRASATGLVLGALHPIAGDITWQGRGRSADISAATVRAGSSELTMAGTLGASEARLTMLRFNQDGEQRLQLAQPTTIRWTPDWGVEELRLIGQDVEIALSTTIGPAGKVDVSVRNVTSAWARDFVTMPGPEWKIANLNATGVWDRGPVQFSANTNMVVTLAPERAATITLTANGNDERTTIESLRVAEGAAPILTAQGRLPLSLHLEAKPFVQLHENSPLELIATTAPNPEFWKKLTEASGLALERPELNVELRGTWNRPQGVVVARAERVTADPQRIKTNFPTFEAVDARVVAGEKDLTLERFSLRIDGQPVSATGRLPFTIERWDEMRADPLRFFRERADLQVRVADAEMAALARYAPKLLAPVGRLEIDATLKAGGEMSGSVQIRDAASRPIGPLGVLQEISADLQLAGRTLEVRTVSAKAGGQPVTLAGKVELPLGGSPKFDLTLKGENLPFVRQTGLLLRGDLDLKLAPGPDNIPTITGTTRLRDSLFFSDVRALIPTRGRGATRRPPYFAVEAPPLNAWRLNVELRGEEFMRLRTTVFTGVMSARFRLTGTLGEPRATGEAVIEEGQVLFPFAKFEVQQGAVRLTEADPHEPRLSMIGTSRRFGYDLRMELTGTANQPNVTFTSSPPLEARQVLLLVMAGETPRDEVVYSGTQRMARLGTYLGQSLLSNLGGDGGNADRLSISTGERVSRQGNETYHIEYQVNDRLTLVGEYDEFDDYNAGIKWRVATEKKDEDKEKGSDATTEEKSDDQNR